MSTGQDYGRAIATDLHEQWELACCAPDDLMEWLQEHSFARKPAPPLRFGPDLSFDTFCADADVGWCQQQAQAGRCVRVTAGRASDRATA